MREKMKTSKKHPIISYVNYRRRMRHLKHFLCLLAPLIIAFVTIFVISSTGLQITSEGQTFLFSMDAAGLEENVKNLNKGVIPEELRMTFKDEGFPLSENAAIIKETDDEGVITNEGKIYTIKKKEGRLNVYGKIITAPYIAAIAFLPYVVVLILTFLYIPISYIFTKDEVNWHIFLDKIKKAFYISSCIAVIALLVCIILSVWYAYDIPILSRIMGLI